MLLQNIESFEIFAAWFSLVFVAISWILAAIIILKYFKYRAKQLLLVGIAWIGIAMPWTSDSISVILLSTIRMTLNQYAKVIIELTFLPVALVLWLYAFTDLVYPTAQKVVLIISILFCAFFEIWFFSALIIDFRLIGEYTPPLAIEFTIPIYIFLISFLGTFVITGLIMAVKSVRENDKEISLKGKFLVLAFISFLIGTILEVILPLHPIGIMIVRLTLISSAIEYYIGFTLPRFIKELFIRANE